MVLAPATMRALSAAAPGSMAAALAAVFDPEAALAAASDGAGPPCAGFDGAVAGALVSGAWADVAPGAPNWLTRNAVAGGPA